MKHLRNPGFLFYFILFIVCFWIMYFYFFKCQTQVVYGDDLTGFQEQASNSKFMDFFSFGKSCNKFRPVWSIIANLEISIFGKWIPDYFLFNVGIQALITVMFTAVANLLLRSVWLSVLVGLLVGLSRFAYYNITQVLCGGPLEGLAMLFFLAMVYNTLIYLAYDSASRRKSQFYYISWALVFANLAMFTHERYMVLLPLIVLFTLLHPVKNLLSWKQKLGICSVSGTSLFVNFALKEYVYHYRFLQGTGTSPLTQDFNFKRQLGFLGDALASIVQFNSGADYQIGVEYRNTEVWHKALIISSISVLCVMIIWFVISNLRARAKGNSDFVRSLKLIFCLLLIFFACLAPAVSTIDLVQRWLQAPFAIFVLVSIIVFAGINTRFVARKTIVFLVFIFSFAVSDYYYMTRLNSHFWMKSSEWLVTCFKNLIDYGFITKELNTIYVLEDRRSAAENGVNWGLWYGYFFDFYQGKSKTILFMDSTKFTEGYQLNYLINFDRKTDLIIELKSGVTFVTDTVLKERDIYFKEHGIIAKNK